MFGGLDTFFDAFFDVVSAFFMSILYHIYGK